jgi:hypothetical protein
MIALALGLALGSSSQPPLQAVARDTAEPVILEVALGRLTSATFAAFRLGERALVPVDELFELAEIRIVSATDSTLEARLEPGGLVYRVDLRARRISVDGTLTSIRPGQARSMDGKLYLDTGPLGASLGLAWSVNWADLTATIVEPSGLPIARRIARDWQRRREQSRGGPGGAIDRRLGAERRTVDGLVLDYSVYAPSTGGLRDASYSTAVGLDLLGGSFTAGVQNQVGGQGNGVRTDVAWAGVWRNRPWLRQLRLGDGLSSGPRPRSVRGVSFGNSPYLRANEFGEAAFSGELGPGWQVEAYRGGRLIAFDSVNALGRFSVDAPIAYGENPIELVGYGPFGEVRRLNRTYRVDPNRLPTRRFEYTASFGQCRIDQCRTTANADLRYGLSNRWTVVAGIDHFGRTDSLGDLAHPYVAISGAIDNAVAVQFDAVANAILRGTVRYEPSTNLMVSAEFTRFDQGVTAPILTPLGRSSQLTVAGVYYPSPTVPGLFLDGSIDVIRSAAATQTSGRLGASYQAGQLQLLPAVRWQRTRATGSTSGLTTIGINAYLLPVPGLGPVFGRLTSRAVIETRGSLAAENIALYTSRDVARNVRLELGGGWSRFQGPTASLSLAANLRAIRSVTTGASSRAGTTASQFVQGSVLYDRSARRVDLSAGPSLERAGVSGRVFLDRNGNQVFDQGEDLLPNVRVTVGMETRQSDRQGEYRLWNVTPFEEAVVGIDSTTLESPLWLPTYGTTAVEASPNRYRVVDIPITPGGLLEGRVVRVDSLGERGAAGVPLRLIDQVSGASRKLTSFSDGDFYLIGITPGRYTLWVDLEYATRFGLDVRPIDVEIASSPDGAVVSGLLLRLDRRR